MKKTRLTRLIAVGVLSALIASAVTGCRFGFASDPDDPNAERHQHHSAELQSRDPDGACGDERGV